MNEIGFSIPLEPVAKGRPRVGRRGGHAYAYTPAKTRQAEGDLRLFMHSGLPYGFQPFSGPVTALIDIFVRMPTSLPKKAREGARPTKKPDVDNFAKTVLDAAEGIVYLRDSQVVMLRAEKHYAPFGTPPYWSLRFRELP